MDQLCWNCSKATNENLCPWVREFIYPEGVELDSENYIVSCPLFHPDKYRTIRRKDRIISKRFGISERTYFRHKEQYNELYERYEHYINIPKVDKLCEFFGENKQKIMKNYEFYLKKFISEHK